MKFLRLVILPLYVALVRAETITDSQQPLIRSPEARIIGGYNAQQGQFPYQIALQVNGRFSCGGTIIAQNYVLTAAHCVTRGITNRP